MANSALDLTTRPPRIEFRPDVDDWQQVPEDDNVDPDTTDQENFDADRFVDHTDSLQEARRVQQIVNAAGPTPGGGGGEVSPDPYYQPG